MTVKKIGDIAEILLDYFENNKTFQADKIMSVSAAAYTDPDQWRTEVNLIFKRVPLMLALSCEIPKPGDYKALDVVGSPVLIMRNKAGVVRAFLNVCAHRWAPLVAEGHGHCKSFRLTCPFHGWTYGVDGKLLGVADVAKFGNLEQSTHGLKELPCEERYGMIFACLTPDTLLDLAGYYGALLEEYAHAGLKDWTFLGSCALEGPNWKLTLNNFLESYHFSTLHAQTVAPLLVPNSTHYEGFGPNLRVSVSYRPIGKLRQVPREQWGQREGEEFGFIRVFFPNVTGAFLGSAFERSVIFTQTLPGETPDKCRIVVLVALPYAPKDEAQRKQLEKEFLQNDAASVEDNSINMAIQKGLRSGAHSGLLYGQNEGGNQYFQDWVSWYLKADPSIPQPVLRCAPIK